MSRNETRSSEATDWIFKKRGFHMLKRKFGMIFQRMLEEIKINMALNDTYKSIVPSVAIFFYKYL